MRELAPGLTEEWVEGFGGVLSRRGGFSGNGATHGSRLLPPARTAVPAPVPAAARAEGEGAAFDDCQLWPESDAPAPDAPIPPRFAAQRPEPTPAGKSGADADRLCHCRHRIFGRGKIIKHLPPDKVQVNFPGFGLKVILTEYLLMEN